MEKLKAIGEWIQRNAKNLLFYIGLPAVAVASVVLFTVVFLNRGAAQTVAPDTTESSATESSSLSSELEMPSSSGVSSRTESSSGSDTSSESEPEDAWRPDETVTERYAEAVEINSDVKAWLQIPGTGVDYPVLQAHDNNFYLEKDINKSYDWYGSIFAHFRNNLSDPEHLPRNTVLFGHNKDDGLLFGELLDYSVLEYASEHRYITLTIGETTTYWLIFSVMDCEVNNDVFYYIDALPSNDALTEIIDQSFDRSFWDYGLEVDRTDRLLTLSTCTYKYTYASGACRTDVRYVVMARQVRPGEVPEALEAPVANADRRQPKF